MGFVPSPFTLLHPAHPVILSKKNPQEAPPASASGFASTTNEKTKTRRDDRMDRMIKREPHGLSTEPLHAPASHPSCHPVKKVLPAFASLPQLLAPVARREGFPRKDEAGRPRQDRMDGMIDPMPGWFPILSSCQKNPLKKTRYARLRYAIARAEWGGHS